MAGNALKIWIATLVAGLTLATSVTAHAQDKVPWTHPGPLLPDSSNFVTASLLIASPGEAIYSQFGHAAIRMECPVHNLDYCFSFGEEPGMGGVIKFFTGKTDAHMFAIPTSEFLSEYKEEGRQVMQYELNLTTHEKQELWRQLDNDFVDEEMRHFNFLQNNCSSVSLRAVESVMDEESIDFNGWPEEYKLSNGAIMKFQERHSPWLIFLCITFLGSESDIYWTNEQRTGPALLVDVAKKASIANADGQKRPLVIGVKQLMPLKNSFKASPITPLWVFGLLLLAVVLITLAQLKWKLKPLGRTLDILLMVFVTVVGLFLIYTSFVSGLFGTHWNWYLIPFNPLPLIIWLIWRKRIGFYNVYLFYTAVLILFIMATPLSEQLDLPHQLITATLAARCLFNYIDGKRNAAITTKTKKKNHKNKK